MHRPFKKHLEEYLSGTDPGRLPREFGAHAEECRDCGDVAERMKAQAMLLRVLRPEEDTGPAAGFYARVMERIEARRRASALNAFLDPAFVRRVVIVCAAVLILLAGYIVRTEPSGIVAYSGPEVIFVQGPQPQVQGLNPERDRQAVLVTLATYQE